MSALGRTSASGMRCSVASAKPDVVHHAAAAGAEREQVVHGQPLAAILHGHHDDLGPHGARHLAHRALPDLSGGTTRRVELPPGTDEPDHLPEAVRLPLHRARQVTGARPGPEEERRGWARRPPPASARGRR